MPDIPVLKLIIVGDSNVGKTCLLSRYITKNFNPDYTVTVGVEFSSKNIYYHGNNKYRIQIWDTAGQESFRSIIRSFYQKATAVLIIYNIANRKSFERIDEWINEAKENSEDDVVFVLIGNKNDEEIKYVTFDEGKLKQEEYKLHLFYEASAKSGSNVEEIFQHTIRKILENPKYHKSQITQESSSDVALLCDKKKEKTSLCCN